MTTDAAWTNACDAITRNDPHTRGIVVLGLAADEERLAASFKVAARHPLAKGFAVGRTIFGAAAERYMAGTTPDAEIVRDMAAKYARLCKLWDDARADVRRNAA